MPLRIINNVVQHSINDIVELKDQGYSVLKSPHIGNLTKCDLMCAALGIPISLVTFTQGRLDTFFHPHLRIQDGKATALAPDNVWTPFAITDDGVRIEDLHLQSLVERFPDVSILTDAQIIAQHRDLAEIAFSAITNESPGIWYRQTSEQGVVTKIRKDDNANGPQCWDDISDDVFRFTNDSSGWVIPNRFHIIFELALQSLSSGRDEIYHLAGQQMNGYICRIARSLSKGYDAFRRAYPELPETLTVHVIPVAECRFVSNQANAQAVEDLETALIRFESLPNEEKRNGKSILQEAIKAHPSFVQPEEHRQSLSQYDLTGQSDLVVSDWMRRTKVGRVSNTYRQLQKLAA